MKERRLFALIPEMSYIALNNIRMEKNQSLKAITAEAVDTYIRLEKLKEVTKHNGIEVP